MPSDSWQTFMIIPVESKTVDIAWQKNSPYFGKYFSVLGDSISTFEGCNPPGYNVFYDAQKQKASAVVQADNTWWKIVIDYFGGELLVNNAWSGSLVSKQPEQDGLFPSACSDERTSALHVGERMPDVILIYLGTNDWGFGVSVENGANACETFASAYRMMLRKLKSNYPHSQIWCCTLSTTYRSDNPDYKFNPTYGGTHMEVYNDVIRQAAREYQCDIADIYHCQTPCDTIDGLHPNASGMRTLAAEVIRSIAGRLR